MSKSKNQSNFVTEYVSSLLKKRIRFLRLISQIAFFVLLNGVIVGLSRIPFPAPISFPAGSPFGTVFGGLDAIQFILTAGSFPFLAFGVFFLTGATVGRFFCGWGCPVGFWQDILSWLPVSKYKVAKDDNKSWSGLSTTILFFILFFSALIGTRVATGEILIEELFTRMPYNVLDPYGTLTVNWFYAFSWGLFPGDAGIFSALDNLGWLFVAKSGILLIISGVSIKIPRAYCRWVCPTGALLGIVGSKHSILTVKRNPIKCVDGCNACEAACPMQVPILDESTDGISNSLCINCGNCIDACPDAMSFAIRL